MRNPQVSVVCGHTHNMSQGAPLQAKRDWNTTCPPPGFDSLRPFDLAAFVGRPWYAQLMVRW